MHSKKFSLNFPTLPSWTLNHSSRCSWTGIQRNEAGSIFELSLQNPGLDRSNSSNLQKLRLLNRGVHYLENPDPVQFKGMAGILNRAWIYPTSS
ncbi:conserved hypothetical protein [Ricinus communis]|uniref:Uncharacterized protein n=1 Tax=Ricinus communis TaxID=3988 RepID=B9SKP3_RICCO|nr:conserved hypothetical protein [Ricinus communis]